MNTIDLIVCLMLVLAVWNGWRQGFVMQVCSLAGIIAGIWVASRYGAEVGAWLKLDETISAAGGFVVVLLAVVLLVAIAGRLVRKLFSAFDTLNEDYTLIGARTIEKSKSYKPVMRLSERIFPFLEWVGKQVPQQAREQDEE